MLYISESLGLFCYSTLLLFFFFPRFYLIDNVSVGFLLFLFSDFSQVFLSSDSCNFLSGYTLQVFFIDSFAYFSQNSL